MKHNMLALDTGGSKSHAVVFSVRGEVRAERYFAGLGVPQDHPQEPLPVLRAAVEEISAFAQEEIDDVVVNLGGKNETQIYNELKRVLPQARISIFRESSGKLADELRRSENADAIVMAGTGVIVFANGSRGYFVADGWGAEVGDAGSGYWIGRKSLCTAFRALEAEEGLSPLTQEITDLEQAFSPVETPDGLVRLRDALRARLQPLDRAGIARFARICAQAAAKGDAQARSILEQAGSEIANTCIRALKKAGAPDAPRVILMGGLTGCIEFWQSAFERTLRAEYPSASWRMLREDLTKGAYQYYRNQLSGSDRT